MTSKLHLVFGGRVADPRTLDFDPATIQIVGMYPDYATAEKAWRSAAQKTVDDAEMRFVVAHLHRLFEPKLQPDDQDSSPKNAKNAAL